MSLCISFCFVLFVYSFFSSLVGDTLRKGEHKLPIFRWRPSLLLDVINVRMVAAPCACGVRSDLLVARSVSYTFVNSLEIPYFLWPKDWPLLWYILIFTRMYYKNHDPVSRGVGAGTIYGIVQMHVFFIHPSSPRIQYTNFLNNPRSMSTHSLNTKVQNSLKDDMLIKCADSKHWFDYQRGMRQNESRQITLVFS